MKNYLSFVRDHSGSMGHLAMAAMNDYNAQIDLIKTAAQQHNQDTIVSVVTIGQGRSATVGVETVNSNVQVLAPLTRYATDANGTPLIESVFKAIELMENVPDASDPDVSFLVMVTTDGQETQARGRGRELAAKIRQLQATDRWTFVFRVPKNGARELATLGINNVNVYEWDTTVQGVQVSTQANVEAFTEYFTQRSTGMKSTNKFYANLEDVSFADLQKSLVDISNDVQFFDVAAHEAGSLIRPFVEAKLNGPMARGGAFYQLVKNEKKIQANKRILIRDKTTGTVFAGDAARQMLALPVYGDVKLQPDNLGDFDVFIQSTSVNRKLDPNTTLVYWENVGTAFKEGPSAR